MDFDRMCAEIGGIGANLYDLALYRDGEIQSHRFQNCNNCNNSYSVAKAFLVTAAGILFDKGLLDVSRKLSFYMGNLMPDDAEQGWKDATVENALTHKLGFDKGFLDIDVDDASKYPSKDYLDIVFHRHLAYTPGEFRRYTDAAYYIVSRLISCIAGEGVDSFLRTGLFEPLHFREVAWSCCPQGYPIGATGLYISSYDMVKLPALYLENGVWEGRRIISEDWINLVLERGYEFAPKSEHGLIGKKGMNCQMVMFSREKGFAVAWHGCDGRKEMTEALIDYFDRFQFSL